MFFVMAFKETSASKSSQIFKFHPSRIRVREYYGSIKINEIAIVRRIALNGTDTVWIMTCRAILTFGIRKSLFEKQ